MEEARTTCGFLLEIDHGNAIEEQRQLEISRVETLGFEIANESH